MRNFPPHPMRASHSPFATVNWSELLCFYCAVPYIIHQRSLWSEKKKLNEEEEEGKTERIEKGILHRQAGRRKDFS